MESNLNWDNWELVNYNSLNQTERTIIPSYLETPKIILEKDILETKTQSLCKTLPFPDIWDLPPLPQSPLISPNLSLDSYVEAFELLTEDPFEELITFFQPTIILASFFITNTLLWLNSPE